MQTYFIHRTYKRFKIIECSYMCLLEGKTEKKSTRAANFTILI